MSLHVCRYCMSMYIIRQRHKEDTEEGHQVYPERLLGYLQNEASLKSIEGIIPKVV